MSKEVRRTDQPRSAFARRLAADPELAERCERIAAQIRKAAEPDIQAGRRSEQLGPNDYGIVINARAEDM